MPWAIVNNDTLEVVTMYAMGGEDLQSDFHGDWGNAQLFSHVKVPEGYKSNIPLAQKDANGVIMLVENPNDNRIELAWQGLRVKRNGLLASSDWRVNVPDSPLSIDQKNAWLAYRQALRDLPASVTDPTNVTWPTPPQ